MTMKNNIIIFFTAAILAAVSTGCSVNEEGILGSFPYLELEVGTKAITKAASSEAVAVTTNRSLSVTVESPQGTWLKAVVEGDQLVLSWSQNELEIPREATVTVSTPNSLVTKTLAVTQDASGELTIREDLILHSKAEIAANTYTKTTENLIVGNVTNIVSKATSSSVSIDLGNREYTASPSDIADSDMDILKEQIHMVAGGKMAVVNTQVSALPVDIVSSNDVKEIYFDHNNLSTLPSAEVMQSLGLKVLSIKGNDVSDISSLAGCSTIEVLDLSGNDVFNLETITSMTGLKSVHLEDLPVTAPLLEVFREKNPNLEVVATEVRPEDSPLPVFGDVVATEISDTQVEIKVQIIANASEVTKTGFYIGNRRNVNEMEWYDATYSDGYLTLTYTAPTLNNVIYYVRAYAENSKGCNYSKAGYFGSLTSEEDMYITSEEDLQKFYDDTYSHVNGSVLVGKTTTSGSAGVKLDDGKFDMYFRSIDLSDLTKLGQLVYVRDGLYIGNVGLKDLNYISHIAGMERLWLRGNKIEKVPELAGAQTVKYLDLSMNKLTDFAFLDQFAALETLYLGSSDKPQNETNDIGLVADLAAYTNLKYIDLSGLPLHAWQVDDLRAAMPNTEIVFSAGGRDPHIPTVKASRVNRDETAVTLNAVVTSAGKSDIIEHGFYYGKDADALEKVKVGDGIASGEKFSYSLDIPETDIDVYYWYPYAVNSQGESRNSLSEFSRAYMDLSQAGTANCYLIQTPGKYKFDATVRGNSTDQVGNAFTAEVVWEFCNPNTLESIIAEVNLNNGYVEFETTEEAQYGNALIAVKDVNGVILWSWHIWMCDFDPEVTAHKTQSGVMLMDRNLGATLSTFSDSDGRYRASGMLYQWGRKDPMNAITVQYIASSPYYNIEDSFSAPTTFVQAWTWLENGGVRGLWSEDQKTMYDPCPPGWKVADRNSWDSIHSLESDGYGVLLRYSSESETVQYPFAPWYNSDWSYVDGYSEGHIWTASLHDDWYPYNFRYEAGWYSTMESRCNSDALSVRCMKDVGFIVSTVDAEVSSESATVYGNVRYSEATTVSERGFVFSPDNMEPTLSSAYVVTAGSGEGDFSAILTDLTPNTTYWVRAYATGEEVTRYGKVISFKTAVSGTGDNDFTEDDYEWE